MKAERSSFSINEISKQVSRLYGMEGKIDILPGYSNQNFLLKTGSGEKFVIKIANPKDPSDALNLQNIALGLLKDRLFKVNVPRVIKARNNQVISQVTASNGEKYRLRVFSYLEGKHLSGHGPLSPAILACLGSALAEMDNILAEYKHQIHDRDNIWDLKQFEWMSFKTHIIKDIRMRSLIDRFLLQYKARITPLLKKLPISLIHNDANGENLLLSASGNESLRLTGIIDFGDMIYTYTAAELAITCAYLELEKKNPLKSISSVIAGYNAVRPLKEFEIEVLFPLIYLRKCMSLTMSAISEIEDPHNKHTQISAREIQRSLKQLESINWLRAENKFRKSCGFTAKTNTFSEPEFKNLPHIKLSQKYIGPALKIAYAEPLTIVKGRGQYLFDRTGRAYLDCVNNVCHVGHGHLRLAAAKEKQSRILNTNTRYLKPLLAEYAKRLADSFPDPLEVCFFVNSGSEANELALRLARTHTGRQDVIVLEDAYHGNTGRLIEMSPYKCEGPGGQGLAKWAHKVTRPDPFRGARRGMDPQTGKAYAEYVLKCLDSLRAENRLPALFICESIMGCAGQIVFPDGYLKEVFAHVRKAGGLCAVDEIQVGFGRVGTNMWAFETQDVVPDMVTLGKPMGNGHPLGAVITTSEIAQSFDNGMEFFNTRGGDPVSCAVGLTVLDIIKEEGLMERAQRVGSYLKNRLIKLADRFDMIGDVRGPGMFLGLEMVLDRENLTPARQETEKIIELVKKDGILLSSDGHFKNVIKIKPPLTFNEFDADLLVNALDRALTKIKV